MAKAAATTAMALATVALTCNGYGKAAGHAAAGTEAYHEITFELDHPVGAGLSHHQPHWCPHDMPIVWKRLAMRKLVDCQTSAIDAVDGCRHRHREVPTCVSVEGCEGRVEEGRGGDGRRFRGGASVRLAMTPFPLQVSGNNGNGKGGGNNGNGIGNGGANL